MVAARRHRRALEVIVIVAALAVDTIARMGRAMPALDPMLSSTSSARSGALDLVLGGRGRGPALPPSPPAAPPLTPLPYTGSRREMERKGSRTAAADVLGRIWEGEGERGEGGCTSAALHSGRATADAPPLRWIYEAEGGMGSGAAPPVASSPLWPRHHHRHLSYARSRRVGRRGEESRRKREG